MAEKKKILESQRELLNIKVNQINQIQRDLNQLKVEFQKTVVRMKEELGVPKDEVSDWGFTQDEKFFEKKEKPDKDK